MNKNNLKNILQSFVNDNNSKSILIDGPWGSGKTFETKEFIKSNKNKKIYYLSLFGLESIDEINTVLYEQTRKNHKRFKQGTILISKAIKAIPLIPDISDAIEYQLGKSNNISIKKKAIVIFDDIERLSDKIQYVDLMGYINSLYLSGCRFICLVSSTNIKSEARKKDFEEFKEKVFDSLYKITGFDENVVNNLFEEYGILNLSKVYKLFDSNIRLAQKTKNFYNKIIIRVKKNNDGKIPFGDLELLKASIYAINICFRNYDYNENKDYYYEYLCSLYGIDTAKSYYYFKTTDEYKADFSIPGFSDVVQSLIKAFQFRDFEDFDRLYFVDNTINDDTILNKEFYYLSDSNKDNYIKKFTSFIYDDIKWTNKETSMLKSILLYSDYCFNDDQIRRLTDLMTKDDNFITDVVCYLELDNKTSIKKNEYFFKKMNQYLIDVNMNNLIKNFTEFYHSCNYNKLINILENVGICDSFIKKEFLKFLEDGNFYIPDISSDINRSIWTYCHTMAKFVNKNEKGKQYINIINGIHKGHKTKSERDRFYALVFYNIDKDIKIEDLA